MYAEGAAGVGREASRAEWRVARTVFVADDETTAREYGRDAAHSPYRQYIDHLRRKFQMGGRLNLFKADQEAPDESVTLETMLDELVICGTPSSVTEQLEAFREQTGDFGEIVYAGVDWADEGLARRSMELMATKVVPAL
jgi:alkanesulfonate monooxygenase SsuD/methylene tetrahydromethanopterin reductase-like flavin-dependent oxidoreductase (luciferase family)